MKRWMLATVFLIGWLIAAVWHMPAAVVAQWLEMPISAAQFSGTVWQGSADRVRLATPAGVVVVGRVNWAPAPSAWWRGDVCLAVDSALDEQQLSGTVCRRLDGGIDVRDLNLELPVGAWSEALAVKMRGDLSVIVEALQIKQDRLAALQARGYWTNAGFHDGRQWVDLPDIAISGQPSTDGGLGLHFGAQGEEAIGIDIESQISPAGRYRTRGRISTTPETPEPLLRWLPVIAQADGDNRFRIDWAGGLDLAAQRHWPRLWVSPRRVASPSGKPPFAVTMIPARR